MKTIFLFLFLSVLYTAQSQVVINVDNNRERLSYRSVFNGGFPIPNAKYVRLVSGSPYFSDTWMKSEVLVNDTSIYEGPLVRLDIRDGTLVYLDDRGDELSSDQLFNAISLTDTISGKNYLFVHSSYITGTSPKEMTWYELLTGENISLFKHYYKRVLETKPFASSVTEQTIETEIRYFIAANNTFTRIKTTEDIARLVTTNKKALQDHIEKNKLKGNSESELIAVVKYYDSLE